jgi:hypothetical protein
MKPHDWSSWQPVTWQWPTGTYLQNRLAEVRRRRLLENGRMAGSAALPEASSRPRVAEVTFSLQREGVRE